MFYVFFLPKTTVLGSGGVLVDALLYVLLDCIACIFFITIFILDRWYFITES